MFLGVFDKAVSLEEVRDLEKIRRLIEPWLGRQGVPLHHLKDAFMIAHGLPTPPHDVRTRSEPRPRETIANYLMLKMMYVSGETGEPSVETTCIIEDIVRQQVIEIVSPPTRVPVGQPGSQLTLTTASKLH